MLPTISTMQWVVLASWDVTCNAFACLLQALQVSPFSIAFYSSETTFRSYKASTACTPCMLLQAQKQLNPPLLFGMTCCTQTCLPACPPACLPAYCSPRLEHSNPQHAALLPCAALMPCVTLPACRAASTPPPPAAAPTWLTTQCSWWATTTPRAAGTSRTPGAPGETFVSSQAHITSCCCCCCWW